LEKSDRKRKNCKSKELANAQALLKQKHQAIHISFPLKKEDVLEEAPSNKNITSEGNADSSYNTGIER